MFSKQKLLKFGIKNAVILLSNKSFENMLPKFLLADNSQELPETIFVVHTKQPRFIVECDVEGFNINQKIHWLDEEPESEALIKELLDLAEEFMEMELESQEELYDEEED